MQIPAELLRECWFLAGPTATGKTACALELAETLNAEILSMDSMALYRGMDIGTAKPTAAERARVPHHLVDLIDPHEEFSVAEYVERAERLCRDLLARGRTPLFVGGTGLYLRSLLRGVFDGPAADWTFRRELQTRAAREGPQALYRELLAVDRPTALRLHPHDQRRIIRALEVRHVTGRPLSQQQQQTALPEPERPQHVFWLHPDRDWLHTRINQRVEDMVQAGLVQEVQYLLAGARPLSHTARQALGYKEVIEHLEGRSSLEATIQTIQTRTRQFAKRQHTWFRNLEECQEVAMRGTESSAELAARIRSLPRSSSE